MFHVGGSFNTTVVFETFGGISDGWCMIGFFWVWCSYMLLILFVMNKNIIVSNEVFFPS